MNSFPKFLLANTLALVLAAPLQLAVAAHHEGEKSDASQGADESSMESGKSMKDDEKAQHKMLPEREWEKEHEKQMEEQREKPYDSGAYPGEDEAG